MDDLHHGQGPGRSNGRARGSGFLLVDPVPFRAPQDQTMPLHPGGFTGSVETDGGIGGGSEHHDRCFVQGQEVSQWFIRKGPDAKGQVINSRQSTVH